LARLTVEGEIEFLGRIDTQVKIRGFRVELAEIESVLLEFPEVKAAAVALREDVSRMQQLVGYIVPRGLPLFEEGKIRARLRERLPVYMVPAIIEALPELPTLPSGKIDRKRLPPHPRGLLRGIEKLFVRSPISSADRGGLGKVIRAVADFGVG